MCMCVSLLAMGNARTTVIQSIFENSSIQDHRSVTQFRFYQQKSDEEKMKEERELKMYFVYSILSIFEIRKSQSFNQNNGRIL